MNQALRQVLRQAAERDIEGGFSYYLEQAGTEAALTFVTTVDDALNHIALFPGTGSPRYGDLLDTPGLRAWLLSGFPFALFYVARDDHLDVLRLLHQQSDIPAQLQFDESN